MNETVSQLEKWLEIQQAHLNSATHLENVSFLFLTSSKITAHAALEVLTLTC